MPLRARVGIVQCVACLGRVRVVCNVVFCVVSVRLGEIARTTQCCASRGYDIRPNRVAETTIARWPAATAAKCNVTPSFASSQGEHTLDTCGAAFRAHSNSNHHTNHNVLVLCRAHKSPGPRKRPGWTPDEHRHERSKFACAASDTVSGRALASKPAVCPCNGAQSTNWRTSDETLRAPQDNTL